MASLESRESQQGSAGLRQAIQHTLRGWNAVSHWSQSVTPASAPSVARMLRPAQLALPQKDLLRPSRGFGACLWARKGTAKMRHGWVALPWGKPNLALTSPRVSKCTQKGRGSPDRQRRSRARRAGEAASAAAARPPAPAAAVAQSEQEPQQTERSQEQQYPAVQRQQQHHQ